jgi:hypothetical protein
MKTHQKQENRQDKGGELDRESEKERGRVRWKAI